MPTIAERPGRATRADGRIRHLLLYLHTVQHLKPRQMAHQVLVRLPRLRRSVTSRSEVPAIDSLGLRAVRQTLSAAAANGADAAGDPTAYRAGRFRFLNHSLDLSRIDWRARYVNQLWTYNLHYFDYARELAIEFLRSSDRAYAADFSDLALSWIEATADQRGDGWDPYPLSIRIVNWTYALATFHDVLAADERYQIQRSLHQQLEVLHRRQEWHLLGNHLQKNLHALLVGGILFHGGRVAERCAGTLTHLWDELREQVLPDGGHFERSPMYHAIALGDFLEDVMLLRAIGAPVPSFATERLGRMTEALGLLSRADGSLHLFNDAADGIAPPTGRLLELARVVLGWKGESGSGPWALPHTGYFGTRDMDGQGRITIDCGSPGPAYQPGHAHCDLLSFELDACGRQIVVDSGVHGYAGDPYRDYVRSTRAHNTLTIDGREQSEIWSVFRMARRATVLEARATHDAHGYHFRGAYRPYHTRRGVHRREIDYSSGTVQVTDLVQDMETAQAESVLHLHPDFTARIDGRQVVASAPGVEVVVDAHGVDELSLHRGETVPMQGWYCPRFGVARDNVAIVMRLGRASGPFGYRITVRRTAGPS